jgi:hypothetical protein
MLAKEVIKAELCACGGGDVVLAVVSPKVVYASGYGF